MAVELAPEVLSLSLDSQIVTGAAGGGGPLLGDSVDRQRRYAGRLAALHVVAKTGRLPVPARVPLAENAWAYPTQSRSRYLFPLDAFRIGARICATNQIDVISAQDPFSTGLVGWALARRFGKPLNLQVHFDVLDNPYWLAERLEHRVLNPLGKWLLRQSQTVRVGTTREREKLASWGIDRRRIHVAPVPVDLEAFAAARPDAALRALRGPGEALVLNASRLVPQKDIPTLLRAVAVLLRHRPSTRLVIAGDGPERDHLEHLTRTLGIQERVHFLGLTDRTLMPALMAGADALAVSSLYEGTSLVTLQAAAAGKPVVTTDVAGAADTILDGVTGRIVPIGNPHALAAALLDVLADPQRAAEIGRAAQSHVRERFDRQRAVDAVIAMWSGTISQPRDKCERRRWLYLANARIPNEKAHSLQIFRMLDALHRQGIGVELAYAARANLPGLADQDPVAFYGLTSKPALTELPSIDPIKLVTIDLPVLNRPPVPAMAFALQQATFALAARRYARASGAPVIYSRDWPVLLAVTALARGGLQTVVWEAHDLPEAGTARRALRSLLPKLDGIVTISQALREDLVALGVPPERLLVAPDAVDLAPFAGPRSQAEARAQLGLPVDKHIIGYAGHLYPWKGAHTLALAARHLPADTLVCIVGGTPADLERFRRFIEVERLTERVHVAGHVPFRQVPTWLAAADVLALPNSGSEAISSRYTSPLKLFEYMAAGRPIVASDLPSLREVLRHGHNAWLVAPDDPLALAAGAKALLEQPARAEFLASQARQDVQGRSWDARAAAIIGFVSQLATAPAG